MKKPFYVWTLDSHPEGSATRMFEGTPAQCRNFIMGRWGHWPPFAFISQIRDHDKFVRRHGL